MNSGSFFRLDLDSSKVVDGITVFEYVDLPDLEERNDGLIYPIRLTITKERASFFVHYYNGHVRPSHTEEVILDLPYKETNIEALSSTIKRVYNTDFPMSTYLLNVMVRRYDSKKDEKLREKIIIKQNEGEYDDLEKEIEIIEKYKCLKESQINIDSYSSLSLWGLVDKQDDGSFVYKIVEDDQNNEQSKEDDKKSEKITKFLRKLLLDFMFDLMHSDVFECSKYYSQMREGLMSDFFFSSIVKKSEYFYNRRLVRARFSIISDNRGYVLSSKKTKLLEKDKQKKERLKHKIDSIRRSIKQCGLNKKTSVPFFNKQRNKLLSFFVKRENRLIKELNLIQEGVAKHNNTDIQFKNIKYLYAERLDEAESAWVETIMSLLADKHFSFSPEWYEDKKADEKDDDYLFRVSDSWFVDPEEEMSRVVFPLSEPDINKEQNWCQRLFSSIKNFFDISSTKVHYLNSFELSNMIGCEDNTSNLARNTKISKWFYRRFDFKDAFGLHLYKRGHVEFFLLLALFAVVFVGSIILPSLGLCVESSNAFWQNPKGFLLFPIVAAAFFIIRFVHFHILIWRKKKSKSLDDLLVLQRLKRELRRISELILCLFGIIAFLWIYNHNNRCQSIVMIVSLFLTIILCCFFLRKRIINKRIINNIHLLLPRLLASITAAWIPLVIGNDIFKERLSWPVWVIIVVVVFTFILYENNKTIPKIKPKWKICRAAELMLISYSMSLVVGFFALNILGDPMSDAVQCCCQKQNSPVSYSWHFLENYDSLTLTVFPEYLVQFSFLAMFIGVFIQMIFEEKNITEM